MTIALQKVKTIGRKKFIIPRLIIWRRLYRKGEDPELGHHPPLSEVVKSKSGLGIGIYKAAVQAQQLGYRLRLDENGENGVRFELSSAATPDA